MTWQAALPLLVLASSLLPGLVIFALPERSRTLRTALNLSGAVVKLFLVVWMLWQSGQGVHYELRAALLPGLDLVLRSSELGLFFVVLSALLWLVTTIYAVGYLEDSPNRSRFFGFFSLCVTATAGAALAGNLITFLAFYEMLTLATYPLVVHRGTAAARRAGRMYLAYTIGGGGVLTLGTLWLYSITGTLEFVPGGIVAPFVDRNATALSAAFVVLVAGIGVKAALVPLHSWLPTAMVAPAPVSALLHAVAVVKVGAFGLMRLVFSTYGVEAASGLGLAQGLAVVAAVTIVYGSLRALAQTNLKRLLAYSTVSQLSYIALGIALGGAVAATGGIVHLVHQGLMKITLFFAAGNLAETLGVHEIRDMRGAGRRMPWSMAAFTLCAFGMIGTPPMAGFISKWYLGIGAVDSDAAWVVWLLAGSSILNAAYFLPIVWAIWFEPPPEQWPHDKRSGRAETSLMLLVPTLFTAAMALAVGLFAATPYSPLEWARLIAARQYAP
ncbi:MAG: monovalent cation/H+ antiporter subunit D family protein [Chromatiales bacterium]|nr:MAG: monovalent cation/H+ antiporter subunit D family protein [Chromatiales bacterium]